MDKQYYERSMTFIMFLMELKHLTTLENNVFIINQFKAMLKEWIVTFLATNEFGYVFHILNIAPCTLFVSPI